MIYFSPVYRYFLMLVLLTNENIRLKMNSKLKKTAVSHRPTHWKTPLIIRQTKVLASSGFCEESFFVLSKSAVKFLINSVRQSEAWLYVSLCTHNPMYNRPFCLSRLFSATIQLFYFCLTPLHPVLLLRLHANV